MSEIISIANLGGTGSFSIEREAAGFRNGN